MVDFHVMDDSLVRTTQYKLLVNLLAKLLHDALVIEICHHRFSRF